jgi:hypothetical protein
MPGFREPDQADESEPGPKSARVPAHGDGEPGEPGGALLTGEPPGGTALRDRELPRAPRPGRVRQQTPAPPLQPHLH